MKQSELKVYYGYGDIDSKLDNEIEKTLKTFGYRRWASGFNLEDGIRDIAFDKE